MRVRVRGRILKLNHKSFLVSINNFSSPLTYLLKNVALYFEFSNFS